LTSKNVKEVQKFPGLVNYFWQFIKDFTKVTASLYLLVRKEVGKRIEKDIPENKKNIHIRTSTGSL